jgi:MoaA/NifB/PqqE/SkfB family radical SAM enzyme
MARKWYSSIGGKLKWHPRRVADWLEGKRIAPIHIDCGLSKGCNIHCHYCFGVLQGTHYKQGDIPIFPKEHLLNYLRSAGEVGVKSIGLIGEGEPTLNPALNEAICVGRGAGIDMSLATNGILFKPDKEVLGNLTWIRFNISAASDEAYKRLHASNKFNKAVESIKKSVELKRRHNLETTIGMQMVLTPKDVDEAIPLARLGKRLGVDYLVVKQCSDTLASSLGVYKHLDEMREKYQTVLKEAEAESLEDYKVFVKWGKIMDTSQEYKQCLGVPFLLYSSGDGKLFPCGMHFAEKHWEEFMMGDLTKNTFEEIWKSDRYWDVVKKVREKGTTELGCYTGCRTHAINCYLWDLTHPPEHVNFA